MEQSLITNSELILRGECESPAMLVAKFEEYLPRYISSMNPSRDTILAYRTGINTFLKWCSEHEFNPYNATDHTMRYFIEELYRRNFKDATVQLYFIAIKTFFRIALKLKFISENPCDDIQVKGVDYSEERYNFYTPEQINQIYRVIDTEKDYFKRARNMLMFYLMAIEGLRAIEVHRLNDEDITFAPRSIYVRGKGHNGMIYPCDDTIDVLWEYYSERPRSKKEDNLTPTIVSYTTGERLSRNRITTLTNGFLTKAGLKVKGSACHSLRHSCGTNLYAETKDLRLVQSTLRHRSPNETSRYVHVIEAQLNQPTSCLSPRK